MLASPLRHHRRTPSIGRQPVKETLDACLIYEDDEEGGQGTRVNQYCLKREIGRGSFGAVHLAVDQEGRQYAVKEFSKSRLRKRSQSQILRRPHPANRRGGFLNPQLHRRSASEIHREQEAGNPLFLILEEIAILKKLDHENIVRLYEVLDDPDGDSLYMVLEMCEKGVVMKVGLDEKATPYPEEQCRLWFRDMILGIEYLHAQGIIHRDIKPDNLLLTSDDVLKIVDFGVSEMFQKNGPMVTAKSAGSPAFLPPELCYAGHGDVDGCAADVWSMGVTLYCLFYGCLPFNHFGIIDLYEAIKHDDYAVTPETSPELVDLFRRILEKDPAKRIKIHELREHPWVTRNGTDKLLKSEENTAEFIEAPTEQEMASAITKSIRHVMTIVRAVRKLKQLRFRRPKFDPSQCSVTKPMDAVMLDTSMPLKLNTDQPLDPGYFASPTDISPAIGSLSLHGVLPSPGGSTVCSPEPSIHRDNNTGFGYPRIEVQVEESWIAERATTNGESHTDDALDRIPRHINIDTNYPPADDLHQGICESPMVAEVNIYEQSFAIQNT